MYVTNTNDEDFGDAGAAVRVTHGAVIFDYGAAGELLLWTGALVTPRDFAAEDPIELPAGELDLSFPAGDQGIQDAAIKAAVDALIGGTGSATCLLGTRAMGGDGKANEVAVAGYTRQTLEISTGAGNAPA